MKPCPLCSSAHVQNFFQHQLKEFGQTQQRNYWLCNHCGLVFLEPEQRLSAESERERYQTHNNDLQQDGYRSFLNRLWQPLKNAISSGHVGLDYGCGPSQALVQMAKDEGFRMKGYDPFFFDDQTVLQDTYDFVTCTEAAEHFYWPGKEFKSLKRLLRENAVLAVMTKMLMNPDDFATWYYHRDPTHVCFYQPKTMQWLAHEHGWQLEVVSEQVVLFFQGQVPALFHQ